MEDERVDTDCYNATDRAIPLWDGPFLSRRSLRRMVMSRCPSRCAVMPDDIPVCVLLDQCDRALAHDTVGWGKPMEPKNDDDALPESDMRWAGRLGDSRKGVPIWGSRGARDVGAGPTLHSTAVGLAEV